MVKYKLESFFPHGQFQKYRITAPPSLPRAGKNYNFKCKKKNSLLFFFYLRTTNKSFINASLINFRVKAPR